MVKSTACLYGNHIECESQQCLCRCHLAERPDQKPQREEPQKSPISCFISEKQGVFMTPPVGRKPGGACGRKDLLRRLKATQCCDPVIDDLLSAAIAELERESEAERELEAALVEVVSWWDCHGKQALRSAEPHGITMARTALAAWKASK